MLSFKQFLTEKQEYEKYVSFPGRILLLGFGSVGQAILPLVLRHLKVNPEKITVLEKDDHTELMGQYTKLGVKYVKKEILRKNLSSTLREYLANGDMLLNLSLNIDGIEIVQWCLENDVLYIDTSIERWGDEEDETIPELADRTLYKTHQDMRKMVAQFRNATTAVCTNGANPGLVTYFAKQALMNLAEKAEMKITEPVTKEQWAQLAKKLKVRVIQIAERDSQIVDDPKKVGEFVNSWSPEGFYAEGRAPSELGWGTHENTVPVNGNVQKGGTAAYLNVPGMAVLAKGWVPSGPYVGNVVQHSEAITLSEFLTTESGDYRPTVYYCYQPTDCALASVHEMRGRELDMQTKQRVIKNEIISGMDELGVLLLMDNEMGGYWYGSRLDINEARKLVPGESATSLQVASSLLGAIVWMIKHPHEGYVEPEDLPYKEILDIAMPYLGPVKGFFTDWNPIDDRDSLYKPKFDKKNKFSFENFRALH